MRVSPITNEPEIAIRPDPEACARTAADMIATALIDSAKQRDSAHWATTGGSTPALIYRNLALPPLRDRIPWELVDLWWGDERFVPLDHPLSNAKIALADLLEIGALSGESGTGAYGVDVVGRRTAGAPIHAEKVHPIPTGQAIAEGAGPIWAAQRYAEMLRDDGPPVDGRWPAFDLILLGIGPDGHVLSVFPGSETFDKDDTALAVPAPTHVEPHVARVTLNPRVLDVARRIIVMAHGAAKASIIAEVLGSVRDERRWPAQLARRAGATWILDQAAASAIDR
jgi:6-phosphogluconolactonase